MLKLIFAVLISTAYAQDTSTLQRAISVLQIQRNTAMDVAANAETQLALAREEISKLKAELEELKKKPQWGGSGSTQNPNIEVPNAK